MADEHDDVEQEEDFEIEAKQLGWQPEEQFKGSKDKWIPAKEFVEKGRFVVPILQQNNRRLQQQALTQTQKIGKLEQELKDLNTSFDSIEKRLSKVDQQAFVRAKAQLTAELKVAREAGDVDAEVDVQDRMDQLRKATEEEPKKKITATKVEPTQVELDPVLKDWMKRNTWFGDQTNSESKKKTKEFMRIGEDLRDEGFSGDMQEYTEAVEREYEKRHPVERATSKVEGGGRSSSNGAGGGNKGWAGLPADAKKACMEFADSIVGPGKRYKTLEDWQKKYAKDYYEEA